MPTLNPTDPQPTKTAAKKTTPRKTTDGGSSSDWTAERFAREVLQQLRLPVTDSNIRAFVSWEAREGGHWDNTATFNPLNTTLQMPGSHVMAGGNSAGVQAYTSWQQGVEATAQTLSSNLYGDIRGAFQTHSNDPGAVLNAVASNPHWNPGGYSAISLVGSAQEYGTGTGVAAPASDGQMGTPKPLTVKQYLDDPTVQADYGYLIGYLHDPQIGPILARAAKNGWGANQLLGALSKTKWWQNTAASARSWQAQQRLDPATARQRLNQMTGQIQQLASSTLGFKLDPGRAGQIANSALAGNWSQAQLQKAVGAEFHYGNKQQALGGAAGQTVDQFKQMSRDYLVPISDHTIGQWTKGVLEGTNQPQDFQHYLITQAKSLYPTLSSALDAGTTVSQYLNPYAQLAAQTLEISPDSIDWFNPKWSKAINTTTPDGQRAPMSLSDWGSYLRSLPDYKTTAGANQQAASFALNLLNEFGKVAT